jgi:hypothetical protein
MKRPSSPPLLALLAAAALAGCGGLPETTSPAGGTPDAAAPLTFWQDVAPLFSQRCVSCHQQGGIGPFRLDAYETAKLRAPMIAAKVKDRTMPPWLATGDGTCGQFAASRWLSDAEIQTISRWAEQGAAEGTPRTDLRLAPPATLGEAVEVATPLFRPEPRGDTRAHADDYRCFLVDAKVTAPQFLTGYEVVPGTPAMIHHVLLMQVDGTKPGGGGKTNAETIQALDEASPDKDGWPCYGLAGEGVQVDGVPVTWAPGMGVVGYPAGTGVLVTPKSRFVLQVHYNLADPALRGRTDVTKVRLRMAAAVERPGLFDIQDEFLRTLTTATPAALAPGQARVEYTWQIDYDKYLAAFGAPYFDVYGIFPHMHQYGRTQRVEIMKGGAPKACAVDVKSWDFNWQLYYFYDQPLRLEPGDKVRVTCGFDTSKRTDAVLPGWGTENEMCFLGLFLVPPKR